MSLRGGGPIEELTVPSGTTVEEHDLVTDGDVLVGGQSTVEFGLRGRNVALGERVSVENDIEAEGDCRLDTWCSVDGNVLVGEDAYLGERVTVTGRLMVSGDLDIGDDVTIEEGFEANGWIVIRNPVPTLVFYFIVLSQLLRLGETDAADDLAEALADGEEVRDPLLIPRGAEISDDAWRVSTPATVGDDCRLHGNLRAESIRVGERNEVFGSLRAREEITVGADTVIHGDVTTRGGTVTVEAGARVLGDVSAGDLVVHDGAEIDGTLRARGEMKLVQETGGGEDRDGEDEAESDEDDESEDADGDEDEADETDAHGLSDEDEASDGDDSTDGDTADSEAVTETDEDDAADEDAESSEESSDDESDADDSEAAGSDVDEPETEERDADAEAT
ncbi:polymer-forming cytoskeletal protein [Halorubrum sp. CSM-61]|uniref:polymer-forming cytoskeletal protein n=1 Tax=Halorubrum sp. CSM-61 TaxID=2485838 RepID=UPI000F4BD226|nr:polymer-forming cytoskeletal protein [Halorubrum sp. CSM-61]